MARSMYAEYSEILNLRNDIKLRPLLHSLSHHLPLKRPHPGFCIVSVLACIRSLPNKLSSVGFTSAVNGARV